MARLFTSGCEIAVDEFGANGSTTRDTVNPRLGKGACWSCDSTVSNTSSSMQFFPVPSAAITPSTNYFFRVYMRFDALPSSSVSIMEDNVGFKVELTASGTLRLINNSLSVQIGSDSAAITTGVYYRIEVSKNINASTQISQLELKLDGTVVATSGPLSIANSGNITLLAGWRTQPGASKLCYIDDIAINDSTGAAQNSYPGSGKILLLPPLGDSAVGTGWTLGTGTAISGGSGSTAVKSTPPVGVADLTAGSDTKQIRNATSNASVNYDANMQSYSAAGINSSDTITVVDPVILTGAPVTTSSKQGTVGVVSNPAITNIALGAGGTAGAFWSGTAAGAYPTGWKWSHGTITYNPVVTKATQPVMRVTQVTASTRIAMVCFMGIYVEYIPQSSLVASKPGSAHARHRRAAQSFDRW